MYLNRAFYRTRYVFCLFEVKHNKAIFLITFLYHPSYLIHSKIIWDSLVKVPAGQKLYNVLIGKTTYCNVYEKHHFEIFYLGLSELYLITSWMLFHFGWISSHWIVSPVLQSKGTDWNFNVVKSLYQKYPKIRNLAMWFDRRRQLRNV